MVQYYGHNSIKQFIRSKPIRFGLKNWALCGSSGYCYHLKLYCGREKNIQEKSPLGSRVVLHLLDQVKRLMSNSHCVAMDNFFTSHELLVTLSRMDIPTIGTIRENRTAHCPLPGDKEMKRLGRGNSSGKVDIENGIYMIKWLDNRPVTVATNFQVDNDSVVCQRWMKGTGGKTDVSMPSLIKTYNNSMGGVDQMDNNVNCYRIAVHGKKWYWSLVTNIIDVVISNCWIIHKKLGISQQMDQLQFKSYIALTLLKRSTRSSSSLAASSIVPAICAIRYDGKDHFLGSRSNQRRCQGSACSRKPTTFCKKCNITLCKECFPFYHTR